MGANVRSNGRVVIGILLFRNRSQSRLLSLICMAGALIRDYSEGYFGVATRAHIYLRVFRQKLSSFIISRSICVKRRNELKMKPAAVIHMLSLRNFKIGSYTRSPYIYIYRYVYSCFASSLLGAIGLVARVLPQ